MPPVRVPPPVPPKPPSPFRKTAPPLPGTPPIPDVPPPSDEEESFYLVNTASKDSVGDSSMEASFSSEDQGSPIKPPVGFSDEESQSSATPSVSTGDMDGFWTDDSNQATREVPYHYHQKSESLDSDSTPLSPRMPPDGHEFPDKRCPSTSPPAVPSVNSFHIGKADDRNVQVSPSPAHIQVHHVKQEQNNNNADMPEHKGDLHTPPDKDSPVPGQRSLPEIATAVRRLPGTRSREPTPEIDRKTAWQEKRTLPAIPPRTGLYDTTGKLSRTKKKEDDPSDLSVKDKASIFGNIVTGRKLPSMPHFRKSLGHEDEDVHSGGVVSPESNAKPKTKTVVQRLPLNPHLKPKSPSWQSKSPELKPKTKPRIYERLRDRDGVFYATPTYSEPEKGAVEEPSAEPVPENQENSLHLQNTPPPAVPEKKSVHVAVAVITEIQDDFDPDSGLYESVPYESTGTEIPSQDVQHETPTRVHYRIQSPNSSLYETPRSDVSQDITSISSDLSQYETPPPPPPQFVTPTPVMQDMPDEQAATLEKIIHREMPPEVEVVHESVNLVDTAEHSADTSLSEQLVTEEQPQSEDDDSKADTSVSDSTSVSEDVRVEVMEEDDTSVSGITSESEEQQENIVFEVVEVKEERRDSSSSVSSRSTETLEDDENLATPQPMLSPPDVATTPPDKVDTARGVDNKSRVSEEDEVKIPANEETVAPSADILEPVENPIESVLPIPASSVPIEELIPETINMEVSDDMTFDLSEVPPPLPPPLEEFVEPSLSASEVNVSERVPSPVHDDKEDEDDAPPLPACPPPPLFDSPPSLDTEVGTIELTDAEPITEDVDDLLPTEPDDVEIALTNASEQLTELTQEEISAEIEMKQTTSDSESGSNLSSSTSSTPQSFAPPLKTLDDKPQSHSPLDEESRTAAPKLKGLTLPNRSTPQGLSSTLPRSGTKKTPPTRFLNHPKEPSPTSSTRFSLKFSLTNLRPVEKKKEDSTSSVKDRIGSRYQPKREFNKLTIPKKDKETDKPKPVTEVTKPLEADVELPSTAPSDAKAEVKPEKVESNREGELKTCDKIEPEAEIQQMVVHSYVESVPEKIVNSELKTVSPVMITAEVEHESPESSVLTSKDKSPSDVTPLDIAVHSEPSTDPETIEVKVENDEINVSPTKVEKGEIDVSPIRVEVRPDLLPSEIKEPQKPKESQVTVPRKLPVVPPKPAPRKQVVPGSTVPAVPAASVDRPDSKKHTSESPKFETTAGKIPSPRTKKGYQFFQSNRTDSPELPSTPPPPPPTSEDKESPSDKPSQDVTSEVAAQRKALLKESMSPSGSQLARETAAVWASKPEDDQDPYKHVTLRKKPEPVRGVYASSLYDQKPASQTDVVVRRSPRQYTTAAEKRWSTPSTLDYRQGRLSTDPPSSLSRGRTASQESGASHGSSSVSSDDDTSLTPLERRYLKMSTSTSKSEERPSFKETSLERRYGRAPRITEKATPEESPVRKRYERTSLSDRKSTSEESVKKSTSESPVQYRYGRPSGRSPASSSEKRWSTPVDFRYERFSYTPSPTSSVLSSQRTSSSSFAQNEPESSSPATLADETTSVKTSTPLTNSQPSWRSRATEDSPSSSPRPLSSRRLRLSGIGSGNGSDSDGATLDDDRPRSSPRPFEMKRSSMIDSPRSVDTDFDNESRLSESSGSTVLLTTGELAQLIEEANQSIEEMHDDSLMVVVLHKDEEHQGLGLTIAGGSDQEIKDITVHRVIHGGLASREGRLQPGDRLLSINGKSLQGVTHSQAHGYLKGDRSYFVLVVSKKSAPRKPEVKKTDGAKSVTVELEKGAGGVGFSLEGGKNSPKGDIPITIKRVFTGGAAEKSGAVHVGDILLKINGEDVSEKSHFEAWSILKKLPDGKVTLVLVKQEKTS